MTKDDLKAKKQWCRDNGVCHRCMNHPIKEGLSRLGRPYTRCERCVKVTNDKPWHEVLYYSAKSRSIRRAKAGRPCPFNITIQDVRDAIDKTGGVCQITGLELKRNTNAIQDDSACLDEIIVGGGYIKGNIVVLSARGNRMKGDNTVQSVERIKGLLESSGLWGSLEKRGR